MSAQREPSLPPPNVIPVEKVERLGELHGRVLVRHGADEYVVSQRGQRDRDPLTRLSDGRVYVAAMEDGELTYHEARLRRPPTPAKAAKPKRRQRIAWKSPLFEAGKPSGGFPLQDGDRVEPLGELSAIHVAELSPSLAQRVAGLPKSTGYTPPRPAATSVLEQLARLRQKGIIPELTPDQATVVYVGATAEGHWPELDRRAPLYAAHLRGTPLRCAWCPEPAAAVLVGGAVVCPEHATERLAPPSPPTLRERVGRALRG